MRTRLNPPLDEPPEKRLRLGENHFPDLDSEDDFFINPNRSEIRPFPRFAHLRDGEDARETQSSEESEVEGEDNLQVVRRHRESEAAANEGAELAVLLAVPDFLENRAPVDAVEEVELEVPQPPEVTQNRAPPRRRAAALPQLGLAPAAPAPPAVAQNRAPPRRRAAALPQLGLAPAAPAPPAVAQNRAPPRRRAAVPSQLGLAPAAPASPCSSS
ncbi:uncharacterized protein LOC111643226 [Copidosoma floridanum]|uniref:uncharacterized protein LOC111643226 n=1 Tax=Copidosoma floridanum TaxID=29053 RepID=UPI000C6F6379|nr:uncharacterized protein LOC111643226 [Copidosoma floridanum]